MESASTGRRRRCGPRAPAPSSSPISARVLPRGACCPMRRRFTSSNGLEAGADPADYAEHRLKPVIGSEGELERWSDLAKRRGRVSPCALHLDTGMSRLGFDSLSDLRLAMERNGAASGADLLMSHFVSSEAAGRFDQFRADLPGSSGAAGVPAPSGVPRQFVRHLPRRAPDLRSGAARLCALRRQPRSGAAKPDAPGRDAVRRRPADALDRGGRDLRLQRANGRRSAERALRRCSRATPTACRAGRERTTNGPGRRS